MHHQCRNAQRQHNPAVAVPQPLQIERLALGGLSSFHLKPSKSIPSHPSPISQRPPRSRLPHTSAIVAPSRSAASASTFHLQTQISLHPSGPPTPLFFQSTSTRPSSTSPLRSPSALPSHANSRAPASIRAPLSCTAPSPARELTRPAPPSSRPPANTPQSRLFPARARASSIRRSLRRPSQSYLHESIARCI